MTNQAKLNHYEGDKKATQHRTTRNTWLSHETTAK